MTKINRIVFVQPNLKWIPWNFKTLWEIHPINICLVAAMIEKDYDINIIDANIDNLSQEEFQKKIAALNPDLVGITLLTMEYGPTAHIAAQLVKQINADIITVLGGIYATQAPDIAGRDGNIDYMVLGEGEFTFPTLLHFLNGQGDLPKRGIAYFKNGERVVQEKSPFIHDLDILPNPAYHLADYGRYTRTLQRISVDSPRTLPYARIMTSRGCPVGCTFCEIESITGKPFRARSVPHIIKEMKFLKEHYGIKALIFDDDNLYISRARARALFQAMIDENLDLKWNAIAVPVFYLSDPLLDTMKASGCQYLDMAVESGVERVLNDIVHKPVKLNHVVNMVKKAKSLGIDVNTHFIIGFPGETWEEIRETIRFAESLDADYTKFFIYQPLPNTPLYKKVMEDKNLMQGYNMKTDVNWSESRLISSEFNPQDLKYLRAYEWERINFGTPSKRQKIAQMMHVSEEALTALRKATLASVHSETYPALSLQEPTNNFVAHMAL